MGSCAGPSSSASCYAQDTERLSDSEDEVEMPDACQPKRRKMECASSTAKYRQAFKSMASQTEEQSRRNEPPTTNRPVFIYSALRPKRNQSKVKESILIKYDMNVSLNLEKLA